MAGEGDPPPDLNSRQGEGSASASFLRAARAGNLDKVLELLRSGTDINTCNANGLNALHLASKEGHSEVVRELLKRGAHVDSATKKGNTALHISSLAGQSLIVTILVENGANVNVQSLNGFTPLYMAAQENHEDVVRFLLSHGANQALSTEDGFTPLAVALQQGHDRVVAVLLENDARGKVRLPALHIAAKKDDIRAATLLLQNEHNADVTSKSGFTPLHIAAHYGNENVAQLLIDKGANVNYQARHNISPLHVATKWGRTNMVELLLKHGAIIDSRTRDLLTPLHCASRSGHDQVVDLLLEKGAPISAKTKNGLAPLHMAAQGDHVDSARILLYHRAPVDDVTVDYLTPLHVAAHCGHVRVAKLLLDRNADPNARALNGFTPLHIACKKNRIKVVELLLKYHAAIEATTESGLSPLHVASFMGAINIVIYLLQQGANPDVATVRGETPLHLAARANQTDVVRVLIRNGAKVDAQARELQTPLHIASRLGNTDIVVLLLQAGANPNAATRDQYTPLHIAAKEGQEEVAAILLDHNAEKNVLTKKGFTPLHLASKYGNVEVAKLLLERGTPVDIEGKNQVTPLHVAAHYNNDKVAMLLLEHGASAKAAAKNGYTPLHIAAKKNQMEIAGTLLQYHADPNAKSRAGFTPLHLAAQEGHREMSALLIENGSDVGAKANNGLTAMHLCAQEDRVPVAEELVKHNADVNSQTNAGYTPLHVACHFGQLNMVRFLVEHGANVGETTHASYTPLHQAAQQGHNHCVRYLLEHGASPNAQTTNGQTPLSIAQRLGYVSVVETLKTVTETTVITETTTVADDRYKPQNPEAMNETMFSESEDEGAAAEHEAATAHVKDFSDTLTQGLADSTGVHMIHTGEQLLSKSAEFDGSTPRIATVATADGPDRLDELIRKAQAQPMHTAVNDISVLDRSFTANDNVPIGHNVTQPRENCVKYKGFTTLFKLTKMCIYSKLQHKTFLISFLVDARGGAMRGCRHSGVRIIIPPRKASQPIRVTCRYLRKDKLAHPPPLSEGEELASRIIEMAPAGAKFLGPVILEVPHFASLRDREREIVILRSDDGQHWKEHQLEATEDAVQEVLNESFDAEELAQLDDLHTPRITRILTNDFPMYFAVVTRVRQEVHCVGPEGGVIMSSVVPRVQAIFPDGSLTKTIKVSVQAQPVPQDMVTRLHGNRVAVSPIVTVEPRRRKFHKPITLCIPLPQSSNKGMLTQYSGQPGQEPPTLRLLCSITGGSAPAQWEDITGTTQLTFTGDEVSFTTTVSARFWLMDCQTPRDAARMAQEVYNEAICIPYMAKFAVFARRTFPVEGQLRVFCMTDDKEDKTLEKQEHFKLVAKSRDVEVLKGKHQFLEFAGNLVPVTKSGDQLSLYFLPFQENRLAFMVKTRNKDDSEASTEGRIAFMSEPKIRSESLPPQQPICTLAISLPEYTGETPKIVVKKDTTPFEVKYRGVLDKELPDYVHNNVIKGVGADWQRLARALELPHKDIQYIRQHYPGKEITNVLKIWIHLKKEEASHSLSYGNGSDSPASKRFDPPKYVDLPATIQRTFDAPSAVSRHTVQHEEAMIEEPSKEAVSAGSAGYIYTPKLPTAAHVETLVEEPERAKVTIPEEEETVSEVRTVVRTERHVHDTEDGPVVEERTITTTYEDDVAVNEHIVDRTVPLNEEEHRKWEELNRLAGHKAYVSDGQEESLPEGMAQEVDTEKYTEPDGTVVTTTTITSHYTSQSPAPISEEDEEDEDAVQVVAGVTENGEMICSGIITASNGTSAQQVHHVSPLNKYEAEDWSGEHAEHHHMDDDVFSHATAPHPSGDEETIADENTPIASSEQFERNRSASLAAALLEIDPKGTPQIGFFHPAGIAPLLEVEEEGVPIPVAIEAESEPSGTADPEVGDAERVLSELLLTLNGMKMAAPDRYSAAVSRLRELEEELRAAGAVTPADPQVADAVARALAAAGAERDVQIRVNQSRHTTTTKTVYETETPGMVGLEPEKIPSGAPEATPETGTTQKKETAEEGFTNEDGSVVVSKKMTRVVTTTKTTLPGEGEQAPGE
ncbi:Ankyrin-2 [Trichostrongylus colubriformis]|uniref:Ankyrin-2 n=3 Tax=Trichostrongylidae TaxID=6315 RepID=A0AAN8IVG0_TRICO